MSIERCVERAEKYLAEVIDHPDEKDNKDVQQFALRDALTDLRHLCDAKELDFFRALDLSYEVYLEEKADGS